MNGTEKRNLFLNYLAVFVVLIMYFSYLGWRYTLIYPDSDYSNIILESYDVLHGNIFRSGWTLTGYSGLTTDIVYFVWGVLFYGVSPRAYEIGCSIMVMTLILTIFPLVKDKVKENKLFSWLVLLSLSTVIGRFPLSLLRAHTGAFIACFISVGITDYIYRTKNQTSKRHKACVLAYVLVVALATFGDPLVLAVTVSPVCAWSFIAWLRKEISRNAFIKIALVNICCFLLSIVMNRIYYLFGCEKNSFLEYQTLTSLDSLGAKVNLYFRGLFSMVDSTIDMKGISQFGLLFYPISIVMVIIFFVFVVFNIVKFISNKEYDYITVVLGLGFIFLSIAYIITSMSIDITCARYFSYFPMLMTVVILRNTPNLHKNSNAYYFVLLVVLIVAIGKCVSVVDDPKTDPPKQQELASFLSDNDLHCGYASYWNASVTTLYSENDVRVRAVALCGDSLMIEDWFSNSAWYEERSHFVVTSDDDPGGITSDIIISLVGAPDNTLCFDNYTILIYDQDISSYLIR